MTENHEDDNGYPEEWRIDLDLPSDPHDPWGAGLDPWRQTGREHEQRAYTAVTAWLRRDPVAATELMHYVSAVVDAGPQAADNHAATALTAVLGVIDAATHGMRSIGTTDRVAQILSLGPTPIPLDDGDGHDDTCD